ncbi:MAG: hypothetical protein N3J91_06770 [Verrucomicrobiae bacterium]|nr:hypothetical protein [Verrucomicrobiae bacterium]
MNGMFWRARPRGAGAGGPLLLLLLLGLLALGCASSLPGRLERTMTVGRDTFAFANELKWAYTNNPATGRMEHQRREPPPAFAHRCVPMAVAARKFFFHARFEPQQPAVDEREYARRVKAVLSRSARAPSPPGEMIVIPGYAHLYEFSLAHEALLKKALGGAWQSYLNTGNLRMVFPFSRRGQTELARRWETALARHYPPLVHVVTFPRLTLNHTIILTATATPEEVREGAFALEPLPEAVYFKAYDPNMPGRPLLLWYHKTERQFYYPPTEYFAGGRVNVYEVRRSRRY